MQYHFVTVTKFRADILTDHIAKHVGEIANDTAEGGFDVSIKSVDGGCDHIHILFTAEPTTNLTKFTQMTPGESGSEPTAGT